MINEAGDQDLVREAMHGPDYFRCEHFRATMRKVLCVGYQAEALEDNGLPGSFARLRRDPCADCEQGRRVAAELEGNNTEEGGTEKVEERGKKEETGNARVINQGKLCRCGCGAPAYSRGLAKKCYDAWRSGTRPELGEYTRVLERSRRKSPVTSAPSRESGPKAPEPSPGTKTPGSLCLDLQKYPDVLPALRESAHVHIRTVEHQAIAFIMEGLKNSGCAQ